MELLTIVPPPRLFGRLTPDRKAVIPAIQRSGNGELLAVASRDESQARAFAADLGIPRACGS